ncbi:multifunctional oxoglutarate decarboxylase/oxoglutarate dehydrogenase thiamine pyrophosphate-binding subunit/dihydrolipoyllysine-residue succinyltransferase subunit [Nocardioides sp. zg-579]|uniref:Multifunctional oxoglutarate decarboxylase/oxoglutarate dehydrogenase thiamine pyrophosphate-binding subunit/dihydrolipoyllysine-residue succinyltransferase subunit n=1 Tax=Nocardioides marmotae TaxID=2663857 RepID=A0A6I3JB07_9ACTN|nr:multifunctional oxoglutarate decarboxylase/oxoglutarate dehydrogenase thiamine pyrophosphate-binding subunit/dihydrolipoyllysine-residue succinyltransferase subunit [Nocardioides marmotae]MCR6031647.1 multifunctional oxoglutarate decarboxylase/oxoglutarate dehydrogenase thiamine pyrophosphate-binding subunit/dihydrolipoyllysine-residue succinyltransferase subunit [Gordonia jinghuaiqii]MTB95286.1 multifunctional oxoglutarate decarboxylase/oxoglutarate dehydrogenase thiamine pyrophosphate-bindin
MPQSSGNQSSERSSGSEPPADFGANEWLVEEMHEQYKLDPGSVDPMWVKYFAGSGNGSSNGSSKAAEKPAAKAPAKPAEKPAAKAAEKPAEKKAADKPAAPAKAQPKATPRPETKAAEPAKGTSSPTPKESRPADRTEAADEPSYTVLRGIAAATAKNMDISLSVPTATSVRNIPVKLLWDNRIVINGHLERARGGKVSFTHLIGYAIIKAIKALPAMNNTYDEVDGKPTMVTPPHINLGLAIDQVKADGSRQLVAPSIKGCESMDFAQFWTAYEDIVRKAKNNKLTMEDYSGTTVSLTNVGGLGTNNSVPRLMKGQAAIIGVGSMDYPPEFQGASQETIARNAISRILTMTSTYDHRVIQGAQSGEFLGQVAKYLLGQDGFYDEIFRSLRIPYEPIRWNADVSASHDDEIDKQARILELIHAYRVRGHLMADTDPLEYRQRSHPDLRIESHGLTLWDLDREFPTGSFGGEGRRFMKLRHILGTLRDSYCRTTGIEYMHIMDPEQRQWIQERVEQPHKKPPREEQLRILLKLNQAEAFETFLQTKFVGQKRFSLEGGETTIPVIDEICEAAAQADLDEVAIGMAHRGRLNVLANIVGKKYSQIFREFEGNIDPRTVQGSGDVKYHLGAEGEFEADSGDRIKVSVAANPSHLEAVDPVLEGIARAKQDVLDRGADYPVLPLLVHGDAAFAGQGVVAETLNLSQLRGYRTGGTIHLIVNNQVGFTTSPGSSRSSLYATDVARMVQAPIFHVNGDDPEACIRVARLAFEYRQAFNKDVVIDLVCYRRRGHNEGDDPSYTQPLMYDLIEQKRSVRKLYTESLIGRGDITVEEAEQVLRDYQQQLERVFTEVREASTQPSEWTTVPDYPDKPAGEARTAISPEVLKRISDAYTTPPDGFTVHPKVMPQLQRRAQAITDGPIDWGTGEILAFGALLMDGRPVRLAGQDSRRGTFVQRFATIIDRTNADEWTPLSSLTEDQAKFHVYDSLLSEYAALGFEYGYSVARPEALVLWEAQFGDFVNGAQTVIDEFITSGESKWNQQSGVVLLLPHGYEGQGADHSSARIERFLTMAADEAFVVAQPSSPASYFHLLRQHALGERHRPLIVFTPKSMLKRKEAASQPSEFTEGTFRPFVGDAAADPEKVDTLLLCSGRVTWDLMVERGKQEQGERFAIGRVEQLYPRPIDDIKAEIARYPHLKEVRWVQDEPRNMGPWPHYQLNVWPEVDAKVVPVTRPASSSPAVGTVKRHQAEQKELLAQAFA